MKSLERELRKLINPVETRLDKKFCDEIVSYILGVASEWGEQCLGEGSEEKGTEEDIAWSQGYNRALDDVQKSMNKTLKG
jgi:hypothetical protein